MDHITQIKARLPIQEVVGSYIKLDRAGSNLRAICPFHKEKSPSFNVSPSRDAFYCFGCAKGGDIFTFVQEIEGISFPEALKILADRAGVRLPERGVYNNVLENKDERERLIDLMEKTTQIFEAHLRNQPEVETYLKSRGLTDDTIAKFRIGFAPLAWRELYDVLRRKGFSDEEIEKARLTKKVEGKGYYDTFRGRVMFPIMDSSGRVVAFTGRVFGDQKNPDGTSVAKYLNSPEGELYDKSSILFGYDRAKLAIRKADTAVIVEGQMDCIMSHQAGMENTIAISGTALTSHHINLIKRLSNKITFALDMDNAGVQATIRSAKIALSEGMQIKVAMIAEGKDPADFILSQPHNWSGVIDSAVPIVPFLLKLYNKLNLQKDALRERIISEIFPLILSEKSKIAQAQLVTEIARVLQVKESVVFEDLMKAEENLSHNTTEHRENTDILDNEKMVVSRKTMIENDLLGILLWQEGLAEKSVDIEKIRSLYKRICDEYGVNERVVDESDIMKLSIIAENTYNQISRIDDVIHELLNRFEKEIITINCNSISEQIGLIENRGEDPSGLIRQLMHLQQKRNKLDNKIN